jgi:DNA-binding transcriptional LysR family regulator
MERIFMLLQEMEMFYYVAKLGSFTQAADQLDVSKAHISRGIHKLEKELNLQLLYRSTRRLSLTEAGEKMYLHCKNLVEEAEDGMAALSQFTKKPFGTLRISVPSAFANYVLADFLAQFLQHYPDIHPIIELENNIIDLLKSGTDLALRASKLEDSQLVSQKICQISHALYASPQYLKKFGFPKAASDLFQHRCCVYMPHGKPQLFWRIQRGKKIEEINIQPVLASNQAEFLKKMIVAGLGIANLPPFMVQEELKNRSLVNCLPEYVAVQSELYAIYPSKKFLPQKTQVFIHELKEYCLRQPFPS